MLSEKQQAVIAVLVPSRKVRKTYEAMRDMCDWADFLSDTTDREIAHRRGISEREVKRHIAILVDVGLVRRRVVREE
jgi:transcription initiation factor IIE alpha subunit